MAQKAQNVYSEKNLNFFFRKMSHSKEKCKRGTLLHSLTYISLQNIKNLEGVPFGDIKKLSRSRTVPIKMEKGTL